MSMCTKVRCSVGAASLSRKAFARPHFVDRCLAKPAQTAILSFCQQAIDQQACLYFVDQVSVGQLFLDQMSYNRCIAFKA
jgi:hypothetical protein